VISTHQIDRYDAINQLQAAVRAKPNSLADWVILGELAHEVALDAPPDQATRYYQISRDAYEHALALDPNNAGLKAAVQFARDREAGADRFEQIRDQATRTYIEARRRDLAATGHVPTVRAFVPPVPGPGPVPGGVMPAPANEVLSLETPPVEPSTNPTVPSPTPGVAPVVPGAPATVLAGVPAATPAAAEAAIAPSVPGVGPSADAPSQGSGIAYDNPADPVNSVVESHFGVRQVYSVEPYYQPYTAAAGAPYTFQQYSNAAYPPNYYTNPAAAPVTVQRYLQQNPSVWNRGVAPEPTSHTRNPLGR